MFNNNSDDKDENKTNRDTRDISQIKLGLKPNINQFLLLIIVNAFVGAMIGLEQTVIPILGKEEFDLESNVLILSFIASFGLVKSILNLFAGNISDKFGRKNVLVLGWLVGIPVPFILLFAPNWNWILFANVLLGINQGLAWSMTVNMKIDLVGTQQRGLALGLNEFAGYVSVALVGFLTGYIAAVYGLKPYPFYLGIIFPIVGFLISLLLVKDTKEFTKLEIKNYQKDEKRDDEKKQTIDIDSYLKNKNKNLNFREVFLETSWKNRSFLAVSQAGLVNNLVFGVSWGLFTLYFVSFGISVNDTAFLKALHPGVWGFLQLATGPFSDIVGRKKMIYPGMIMQAIGIWLILLSHDIYFGILIGMSILGIGTAFVYPALLAAISDIAHPQWRATSLGVYRFWRDLGFVIGALGIGFIADFFGINIAIQIAGWIALGSGIFVFIVMRETKRTIYKSEL
ncbi:MAG: MFS transporter [Nitrososphaeraceae archaeon]|nr:MFS transporter [Nitrososphaeraceae archaeon]